MSTHQGWLLQSGHIVIDISGSKMVLHMTHRAFSFRCFAANGRGFGADSTNKRKIKSKKRPKDVALEPSEVISGNPKNRDQWVPELRIGSENKSGKQVMDKKFLEKVEAVRRSALEKKKAEENKDYQAIDYDAPIESDKSTIGFGTRVGIGVAVVVFGLVFAFGDFLPYGSVSPSKESAVVKQKLSQEEEEKFKNALQGFQATLSKSPNDPTALEGGFSFQRTVNLESVKDTRLKYSMTTSSSWELGSRESVLINQDCRFHHLHNKKLHFTIHNFISMSTENLRKQPAPF